MRPAIRASIRPMDALLWALALGALVYLYASLWQPAPAASELKILLDNQHIESLDLGENQAFTVDGPLGESELEISNGRVRFISSPCRNQVCVHQGWASHSGELLACLPNRIALVLEGQAANSADIDAVNF